LYLVYNTRAIGRNLQIDYHWGIGDDDLRRSAAAQLLQLSPDVILANGGQALPPVQQVTRALPIIFIGSTDPVAEGLVPRREARRSSSPAGQ
jgi:ABC-type uncharacterized transport system substrate-binding protein